MDRGIVLHHRHLRHSDHAALQTAAANHTTVLPIFVFDPQFYEDGLACDARLRFLHECLKDIDISLFHGDPVEIIQRLNGHVYTIHTATGRYGIERNERLFDAGVNFIEGDGLRRVKRTRNGWNDAIKDWLTADYHESPDNITTIETDITINRIEQQYNISPDKTHVPTGGRSHAQNRLHEFVAEEYWGHISEPTPDTGASQLSPYLRFGCISVREAYQYAVKHLDGRDLTAFKSRLFWNLHYNQKLLDWPGWMDTAVNPALRDYGEYNKKYWTRFKSGQTGYPMVDAAVRQLTETGWLNFRNRAMLASFVGHLLNLPWKLGANWMYYHLIDADPAINYTQWQHQTSRVGTNMYRIYNPRKQARDSDEASDWIPRWIPALDKLPSKYLDRPEKTPVSVQQSCGVRIGEDYPRPVVEYEAARSRAVQRLEQLEPQAVEWFSNDDFRERASFSSRGGDRIPDIDTDDSQQTSLSQF